MCVSSPNRETTTLPPDFRFLSGKAESGVPFSFAYGFFLAKRNGKWPAGKRVKKAMDGERSV